MRTSDLNLVRKKIDGFAINGKSYDVFEPTLKQRITHRSEAKEIYKRLEECRKTEDYAGFNEIQDEWAVREIQIFFPDMSEDVILNLTHTLRNEIIKKVFGVKDEEEQEEKKSRHGAKRVGVK